MPLRDHFHSPLEENTSWEGFHGGWPMVIVQYLKKILPKGYVASPRVHFGAPIEVDVATYEKDAPSWAPRSDSNGNGGVTTMVWSPSKPTLRIESDARNPDEYEVLIHDTKKGRRLVAAVEIVSPSNKDRPESRRQFAAKCAELLRHGIAVSIVDIVTSRHANLYEELLKFLGEQDPASTREPAPIYATSCRWRIEEPKRLTEAWYHPLCVNEPLPTLPLWLSDTLAVPLDLEETYEKTRDDLSLE